MTLVIIINHEMHLLIIHNYSNEFWNRISSLIIIYIIVLYSLTSNQNNYLPNLTLCNVTTSLLPAQFIAENLTVYSTL